MLWVSREEQQLRTVITLDGQLSGDSVEFIDACCRKALARKDAVELFLRDVSAVDGAGWNLLRRLAIKGVRLLGKGVYISYVIQMATSGCDASGKRAI